MLVKRLGTLVLAGMSLIPVPVRGQMTWTPISYVELIADSDLIVSGKISQVARAVHAGGTEDCSRITVAEVLRGTVPQDGIRLDYPSRVGADGAAITPAAADVIFEDGQEGVWFLKKDSGGHYRAPHPGRFRPLLLLGDVRAEVEKYRAR